MSDQHFVAEQLQQQTKTLGRVAVVIDHQDAATVSGAGGSAIASWWPAVLAVGQAAALRARGGHMILATLGLLLGGLHVGAIIGLFTFSLWQNY